jgi:hypothetical protein
MTTDESLEVVFVVAPYRPEKKIPRAFQLRLSPATVAQINEAIDSGRNRSYCGIFHDGTAINFVAKATRSRYGFIQLEPTWP